LAADLAHPKFLGVAPPMDSTSVFHRRNKHILCNTEATENAGLKITNQVKPTNAEMTISDTFNIRRSVVSAMRVTYSRKIVAF